MKKIVMDSFSQEDVKNLSADLSQDNDYIVETAGFVPLQVKFKRFEEQGTILQFHSSEFTASDLRQLYLSPDTEIYPDDDYEDIQEKLQIRQSMLQNILKSKEVASEMKVNSKQESSVATDEDSKELKQQDLPIQ